jgi:heterodisulfide reductase subunit A2
MNSTNSTILVVGAGIGGIRSALDLADTGHQVILIDKSPKLGGTLSQLDHQFPNDHCGMCKMLPTLERDVSSQFCLRKGLFHQNIEIMLSTELVELKGEPGKFEVTLRRTPPLVDQQRCIGCGECTRVCPVEAPDEINAGLTLRKAIYLPVAHSTPNQYLVDSASCTLCGECRKVCPTDAIRLGLDALRSFKILVVDDELIVRDSIKEWLSDEGFSVHMAGSGKEALQMLDESEYGLMLLDVKMPGMDGVEVLKLTRESKPDMPVLMMTAYATVETAVEAMKFGARDYLMKPFDPDIVVKLVKELFETKDSGNEQSLEVGAIIISTGFGLADPKKGLNTYGFGVLPGVVTSMEFERLMSGSGPTRGKLLRPDNGREIRKVAWLQCVGSRNIVENADYCSSVCCMFAIKEAVLAKQKAPGELDTTIFYMDMRTFGKDFQRYRESAEKEAGVRFIRSRVHSVVPEGEALSITYTDTDGSIRQELYDLVVLSTGQKPSKENRELAELAGVDLNPWGFCQVNETHTSRSSREGLFAGGSFGGARDISESIIQAGSASLATSALMASKNVKLSSREYPVPHLRDVGRELPRIAAVLCTCAGAISDASDVERVRKCLRDEDWVEQVMPVERLCSEATWEETTKKLMESGANRILIGACLPHAYGAKLRELAGTMGLSPALIEWVDIRTLAFPDSGMDREETTKEILSKLEMGAAKLREVEPRLPTTLEVVQEALVVGGGIAGMTAALSIADQGFRVMLIEKTPQLGGNLKRLHRTLQGFSPQELLSKTIARVESHSQIQVYRQAHVLRSEGHAGRFLTTIARDGGTEEKLSHGVAILATGGSEAPIHLSECGHCDSILSQLELEERLHKGQLNPADLNTVVMIQCFGSREGERNYCSRVCCASALKHALYLKEQNSELEVYIFYRDMMAYGFMETHFTRARREGIVFIQYKPEEKPVVRVQGNAAAVIGFDPILGRHLELHPDLVVLGTGIVPARQDLLAEAFGVQINENGFFQEADYKWRPVDSMKEGVFLCGTAHSPRSIAESISMAEAAAYRALRILSRKRLSSSSVVAEVRHSLCSLCERCITACPYGVRWKDEDENRIIVNQPFCQGCGSCAAECPNGASVLRGYQDRQVMAVIDAAIGNLD